MQAKIARKSSAIDVFLMFPLKIELAITASGDASIAPIGIDPLINIFEII